MERPEPGLSPPVVTVGVPRFFDRGLGGGEDDRVQPGVDGVDVLEVRPHDLQGGQLLGADGPRQPAGWGADDVAHRARLDGRGRI